MTGDPAAGATVEVCSQSGEFLAQAAYSPASQIRLRVWTFDASVTVDAELVRRQLERAVAARRALGLLDGDACRLVFAEADGLPGLIVDRYGPHLVCQFLTAGIEPWRRAVTEHLERLLAPRGIYERSEAGIRRKEGLPSSRGVLSGEAPPAELELRVAGLREIVDIEHGQKTGAYLDQRANRLRVASHARGARVLDAYAYTGGFGLQCLGAGGAEEATFLDSSAAALAAAARAAERNGFETRCRFIEADVADHLRVLQARGAQFDLIVLDPPKFVHSAQQVNAGCRAYKDINRLAFELLGPGGILATFSCSAHVEASLLQKVIAQAALEAGRDAQILERLTQPPDHPVALHFPESEYLKGFVLRADGDVR